MRCNEFDVLIDEMLSGIFYPEASQHMRECERCNSHYRARAAVRNGLNRLAVAELPGPSRQTDRAVMEAYRRLQQRRAGGSAVPPSKPGTGLPGSSADRVIVFPGRGVPSLWTSRSLWSGAAAAAAVVAIFGATLHMWNGTPVVNTPTAVTAPAKAAAPQVPESPAQVARAVTHRAQRLASAVRSAVRTEAVEAARKASAAAETQEQLVATRSAPERAAVVFGGGESFNSEPVTRQAAGAAPVMQLAGTSTHRVAQSASSTWTGYSNLMYCDPVTCSGPMQVVRIKVPVGQVKPNVGQQVGNGFVNADVVVGPDGVARAIRVAQ
jgi:hypothetical protein